MHKPKIDFNLTDLQDSSELDFEFSETNQNSFKLNFHLPKELLVKDEPHLKMYCYAVPYEPHIFKADKVIIRQKESIYKFENLNVLCMHGTNKNNEHVSSKNQNIKISDIIRTAEQKMKNEKIDILAVCNNGDETYIKNESTLIKAVNSNVYVTILKAKECDKTIVELSLTSEHGQFIGIQERLMEFASFKKEIDEAINTFQ